jgi:TetR/AcrR family transcriptional repressor of nem operon
MRYAESHKEETHKRVLKVAAMALREKGPDRLAVAEVMQAAGLTHGGFYAHFKSKDDFLSETLAEVFAGMARRNDRLVEGLPPREALSKFIDNYMSPRHRDHPASGCPVVALNSDMPRQSKKVRATFDAGLKTMVANFARRLRNAGIGNVDELAPTLLSAMAGAVAVARAVSDRALSDEFLETARKGVRSRLGLDDVKTEGQSR